MRQQKIFFFAVITFLFIISCNPAANNEHSTPAFTPGFYGLEAQSTSINGNIVSSGPVGRGYYTETLQFNEENKLQIEVESDIVNENGLAEAAYRVEDSRLIVNVSASTTSRYPAGEELNFTDFKAVDESFSRTFQANAEAYTFTGPGLLLESQYTDRQDLDDDGNTTETFIRTEFYGYLGLKYDKGGL